MTEQKADMNNTKIGKDKKKQQHFYDKAQNSHEH